MGARQREQSVFRSGTKALPRVKGQCTRQVAATAGMDEPIWWPADQVVGLQFAISIDP